MHICPLVGVCALSNLVCLSVRLCCVAAVADSLIGIFYADFYELTPLESQRASISSAAACMLKKCPWSLCLPTKSDLLLSNGARLKLSYPAAPSSVSPHCPHQQNFSPKPLAPFSPCPLLLEAFIFVAHP